MSDFRPQGRQNSADVFMGVPVGSDEGVLFVRFLDSRANEKGGVGCKSGRIDPVVLDSIIKMECLFITL